MGERVKGLWVKWEPMVHSGVKHLRYLLVSVDNKRPIVIFRTGHPTRPHNVPLGKEHGVDEVRGANKGGTCLRTTDRSRIFVRRGPSSCGRRQ